MPASRTPVALLHDLSAAIASARELDAIYEAALDALMAIGVSRASILLFDRDGVMRFQRWRGISEEYRAAVEGHTPWRPETPDAQPILVPDVTLDPSFSDYLPVFRREGLRALGFVPLIIDRRVIGKFMLYHDAPHAFSAEEVRLARTIALQVAFAIERLRRAQDIERSERRLRFALAAASMGTWEWDLATNQVLWSPELEQIHGVPPGTFQGTFESYQSEIHPDDRGRVFASIERAVRDGVPHDVEYRIVGPDGTVRWVEGKGTVEFDECGRPVRASGVCMNVTRRKQAELERLEYAARAIEANRLKDEFLATLSHELRTPLNAVLGWAHILDARETLPDDVRRPLAVIRRNAEAQLGLINDLLDVARIGTGKLRLQLAPVEVATSLETAIEAVRPAAQARQIAMTVTVQRDVGYIAADAERLGQMLWNLLSNAVKFTQAGGTVSIDARRAGDFVELSIADTGEGIAPDFLPHLFAPFRQADASATRRTGGLGLGLAITRHLAELHGGSISAESAGRGHGSRFVLALPAFTPIAASGLPRPGSGRLNDSFLEGRRVLVVDDHADARELLHTILQQWGATSRVASSAEEARRIIGGDGLFDVLFVDIGMPGEDGYSLLRDLRQRGVVTPAVAVTAYARPDDAARIRGAGFAAHLAKPITPEAIQSAITGILGGAPAIP